MELLQYSSKAYQEYIDEEINLVAHYLNKTNTQIVDDLFLLLRENSKLIVEFSLMMLRNPYKPSDGYSFEEHMRDIQKKS
ncbi:hypothetical protein IGI37_001393 [Enterococcus sp. AZ194]